jgi:hypothetical protein
MNNLSRWCPDIQKIENDFQAISEQAQQAIDITCNIVQETFQEIVKDWADMTKTFEKWSFANLNPNMAAFATKVFQSMPYTAACMVLPKEVILTGLGAAVFAPKLGYDLAILPKRMDDFCIGIATAFSISAITNVVTFGASGNPQHFVAVIINGICALYLYSMVPIEPKPI